MRGAGMPDVADGRPECHLNGVLTQRLEPAAGDSRVRSGLVGSAVGRITRLSSSGH